MFKDNKTTINGMKPVMKEMKKEFKKIKIDQTEVKQDEFGELMEQWNKLQGSTGRRS